MQPAPQLNDYYLQYLRLETGKMILSSKYDKNSKLFFSIIINDHQVLAVFNFLGQQNWTNIVLRYFTPFHLRFFSRLLRS